MSMAHSIGAILRCHLPCSCALRAGKRISHVQINKVVSWWVEDFVIVHCTDQLRRFWKLGRVMELLVFSQRSCCLCGLKGSPSNYVGVPSNILTPYRPLSWNNTVTYPMIRNMHPTSLMRGRSGWSGWPSRTPTTQTTKVGCCLRSQRQSNDWLLTIFVVRVINDID